MLLAVDSLRRRYGASAKGETAIRWAPEFGGVDTNTCGSQMLGIEVAPAGTEAALGR